MLGEDEWQRMELLLRDRIDHIKAYRAETGATIPQAQASALDPGMDFYEALTGLRLAHPDDLWSVRRASYGPVCTACGKPLRTARASFCAECGCRPDRSA